MSIDRDGGGELAEKFNIREVIERTAAKRQHEQQAAAVPEHEEPGTEAVPSMDQLDPLPKPGDPYKKAYSRPANQMLPTLHLLKGDGQIWSYPYSCRVEGPHLLFSDDPGKGGIIVLRFAASVAIEVILGGIRIDDLHIQLGEHRILWVRELSHGKPIMDSTMAVVNNMIVRPVSAEMEKGWPIRQRA